MEMVILTAEMSPKSVSDDDIVESSRFGEWCVKRASLV